MTTVIVKKTTILFYNAAICPKEMQMVWQNSVDPDQAAPLEQPDLVCNVFTQDPVS